MSTNTEKKQLDPIEEMRHEVCKELQGSVTIVGKFSLYFTFQFFSWDEYAYLAQDLLFVIDVIF
jgi:hypothetical protein